MKFERMAALGALGVCGGITVAYLALAWFGMPTPLAGVTGATGGMDVITRNVIWVSALVPTLLFIVTHLAMAKQLRAGRASLND